MRKQCKTCESLRDIKGGLCRKCLNKKRNADRLKRTPEQVEVERKMKATRYAIERDHILAINKRSKDHNLKGKERRRVYSYNLTFEEYRNLMELQDAKCAICGRPETKIHKLTGRVQSLSIDHDHKTDKVRALLCSTCNNGLGCFKDNEELILKAAQYLIKHKEEIE